MMKNKLTDLNNHLFEQLERLNDEELTPEDLDKELKRADGMTKIAAQIIQNGELAYKTMVHMDEYGYNVEKAPNRVPEMLELNGGGIVSDGETQIPAGGRGLYQGQLHDVHGQTDGCHDYGRAGIRRDAGTGARLHEQS